MTRAALVLMMVASSGCIPSTGGQLVSFQATARGPTTAVKGQAFRFTTPKGFDVRLDRASLLLGAVYTNQTNPANWALETSCLLPGVYTGEVRSGLRVDALDPAAQAFPEGGIGTDHLTQSVELWLSDDDINADDSKTAVLEVEGEARQGTQAWPFFGRVTIGKNRATPPRNPALPGSNPICKQRIVSPIPAELALSEGGTLQITVDPRGWFVSVDFAQLQPSPSVVGRFDFVDSALEGGQPDNALFNGLKSVQGPYQIEWIR